MLYAIYSLKGLLRHFLKSLGLINPSQVRAAAFARLQARLFRLADVQVVAVQGFAIWGPDRSASDCEVQVVTSRPSSVLEKDVKRIFLEINLSYDVNMIPFVADQKSTASRLESRRSTPSPTQVRNKTASNTTNIRNQR
jgi:hypothetical protein